MSGSQQTANGLTKSEFLRMRTRLMEAKQRKQSAQQASNAEGGVIRSILKDLENKGGSKLAVKMMDNLADMPEAEAEGVMTDFFRFCGWTGMPNWRAPTEDQPQGALFNEEEKADEEAAAQEHRDSAVRIRGENSARLGHTTGDNPFIVGERDHQTWATAFNAKKQRMSALPPGPTVASIQPRGRGRPPGSGKAAAEAKPAAAKAKGKAAAKAKPKGGKKAAAEPDADTIGDTAGTA